LETEQRFEMKARGKEKCIACAQDLPRKKIKSKPELAKKSAEE
jgi:hypothetical protein